MGVKENCDKCQFFSALESQCRKRAPSVHLVNNGGGNITVNSIFPPTKPENWCGEFEVVKMEIVQ